MAASTGCIGTRARPVTVLLGMSAIGRAHAQVAVVAHPPRAGASARARARVPPSLLSQFAVKCPRDPGRSQEGSNSESPSAGQFGQMKGMPDSGPVPR
eukprot:COSAG02_NODE_3986_length_5948_cov_1.918619_2_plen_98_part_00